MSDMRRREIAPSAECARGAHGVIGKSASSRITRPDVIIWPMPHRSVRATVVCCCLPGRLERSHHAVRDVYDTAGEHKIAKAMSAASLFRRSGRLMALVIRYTVVLVTRILAFSVPTGAAGAER